MRRMILSLGAATLLTLLAAAPAGAAFGLHDFDVTFTEADGSMATQAGSHPFAMTTTFESNVVDDPKAGKLVPEAAVKDGFFGQVPGLAGSPVAVPRCSTLDFLTLRGGEGKGASVPECADGSAVGIATVFLGPEAEGEGNVVRSPVYLLEPAPGSAAKLGWWAEGTPVTTDVGVNDSPPYNIVGAATNISQFIYFYGIELTLWGNPAAPAHDDERGVCYKKEGELCPAGVPNVPFLTLPRACEGPLESSFEVDSWKEPGVWVSGSALTHDDAGNPRGMDGCGRLAFGPQLTAAASTDRASSPSGMTIGFDVNDEGLQNPEGIAQSDIKAATVVLPEGMMLNPSLAEGLVACSEADLARETVGSGPGEGCPEAAKVGSVEAKSPLLPDTTVRGSLYVATPYENPTGSLIALYMVLKEPKLGLLFKLPGKVTPDLKTGQITSTFEDLPQLPVGHFEVRLREGGRSPLISPPHCGTFTTLAKLTPWANPSDLQETTSSYNISQGVSGGPCPPVGTPPFDPGFSAGTLSNAAGSFSPFLMRLTRRDGDQDITRFDAVLPRGVVAKLAGVGRCSDAEIALARTKTGKAEQAVPSCPASSQIGTIMGGAGVGSQLTYVPGRLYLAGPLNGAPLSVVGVVPAVAGPFDVGNVVVRQALRVDPETAEVRVDSSASDPIPHILAGIPLAVRDIQVNVDRSSFTLNPTRCSPFSVAASIWGGGSDPFSPADDAAVARSDRFQAADCLNLGFKPSLSLQLKGGTKRGAFPALRAVVRARPGDANIGKSVVTLPHSAFLAQEHIRTICTRVQFAADQCPQGSVYGRARAITPLLEEPLEGPVYLRSSNHPLPDMVIALHGIVDVDLVGRIDSVNASIRANFEGLPDAPATKVVLEMQGGKKGLVVNSRDLCAHQSRAKASFTGQNGVTRNLRPVVKASCPKHGRRAKRH